MPNAKWNILVYIAAHNDLFDASKATLEQLKQMGGTPGLKLEMLIDLRRGAQRYTYDNQAGKWIVDEYMQHYTQTPPKAGSAICMALDLAKLAEVTSPMNDLAEAVLTDFKNHDQVLWDAQRDSEKTERETGLRKRNRGDTKFGFHLWDIGSIARRLANNSQNARVQAAAQAVLDATQAGAGRAVLANRHLSQDTWYDGIAGLTVYLPPPNVAPRVTPYYKDLAFAKNTAWYKLIQKHSGRR